jgi:hypothetical protein
VQCKRLLALSAVLACLLFSQAAAQRGNVIVRAEGPGVLQADTINGLQAMAISGSVIEFVWSVQTTLPTSYALLGFTLYSPTNPSMDIKWENANTISLLNSWIGNAVCDLGGGQMQTDTNGFLPESFLAGCPSFSPSFQSDTFLDVFSARFRLNDTGIFCIDSAFFPPAGEWFMNDLPNPIPTWGGNA